MNESEQGRLSGGVGTPNRQSGAEASSARWEQAFELFGAGELDQAEILLRQAVRNTPKNDLLRAPYLQVLGRLRAAVGRIRGAVAAFDASFQLLAHDAVQSYDGEIAVRRSAYKRLQGAKDLSVTLAWLHPTRGSITTALRHVRTCKALLPALRRAEPPTAWSSGMGPTDIHRRLSPDGLLIEITRYEPCDFRALWGPRPAHADRYAAFVLGGRGSVPRPIFFDIGSADTVDDLIAAAREELSGEPGIEGGSLTLSVPEWKRFLQLSSTGEKIEIPATQVRSGQRIELRLRVDANELRSLLDRIFSGEPLSVNEIRRLSADGPRPLVSLDSGDALMPLMPRVEPPNHSSARDLAIGETDDEPDTGDTEYAWNVGHRLLHPIARRWRRARHLVIAPDGDFWLYPFAALSDGALTPVLTRADITVVDASDAAAPPPAPEHRAPPLVIADPSLSRNPSPESARSFAPLPGAHDEGLAVAALLGTICHSGDDAMDTLVRTATSPVVLHLATHGFAVPDRRPGGISRAGTEGLRGLELLASMEDPDHRAGLALAGAADWIARGTALPAPGDGVLLAADVVTLNLSGTALVVLSACETGLGQVAADDAPWSLARAFRRSGARVVVMSLWRVPDESTRVLMERFYARLLDGDPPAQALRAAQLALMSAGASPRQWAAFTCWGAEALMPAGIRRPDRDDVATVTTGPTAPPRRALRRPPASEPPRSG